MARVIGEKRRSPTEDEESEESQRAAARRVRVKKERMEQGSLPEPTQTQESSLSDESSDEEGPDSQEMEDEENMLGSLDDEEAMRLYEAARARQPRYTGKIRDAGIVKSITLTNFMCHRHLTADFGPKMNFLVGHNGSGKSAILTAIAIAFGGRAALTGRGTSMGDLVMKGADKAVISLTLENSGSEAFEPETFNPYLVIERTITKAGSSSYKFRATKDGRTLGEKREVLTRIIDRFGLHIESPLTILTQDQARSFLQASDPKTLYSFFLRGTLLHDLLESYTKIQQQIEYFKKLKESEESSIPELQANWDKMARRQREINMLLTKKAQLEDLQRELPWSMVYDSEKNYEVEAEKVRQHERNLEKVKRAEHDAQAKAKTLTDQLDELDKIIKGFTANEAPVKAKRNNQRKDLEKAKEDIAELTSNIKDCEDGIRTEANEVATYEAKIQASTANEVDKDPEVARLRELVAKHEELLANLRRQKPRLEQAVTEATEAVTKAEEIEKRATDARASAGKAESDKAAIIDNLKAQSTNRLNAFGHNISSVMREIDKAKWVMGKPIGPLGMHVKLEDPRYTQAFHSILASTLCQFAVRCDQDRRTMTAILRKCAQQAGYFSGHAPHNRTIPGVIQTAGERFDYSAGDLRHLNETILSKLDIDDEDVKRILINQHSIERTMVWPNISRPNSVTDRIKQLVQEGQHACSFVTADMFNARGGQGRDSSGPLPHYNGYPMLSANTAQNIETNRADLARLVKEREEADKAMHTASAETVKKRADLAAANRELTKINKGIIPTDSKLQQYRNELAEKETVDLGVDFMSLRNEAEGRRRGYEVQLEQLHAELELYNKAKDAAQARMTETEEELERLAPERIRHIEASTKLAQERSTEIANASHWKGKVTKDTAELERLQAQAEAKRDQVKRYEAFALTCTANRRIETDRPPREIEREVEAARTAVQRAEQQTGQSAEEVTRQFKTAEERLKKAKQTVADMEKSRRVFDNALTARHAYWKQELARSSIAANCSFVESMAKREFEGTITFNHAESEMNIRVSENGAQQHLDDEGQPIASLRQYKTPKTMSGGERSFTTVSLLLAMWDLSSSPMRCLDEWDVFLDPANRSVAAQMLLDGAKTSYETQFILITPQDMNNIPVTGDHNKVIRMKDPIRNQGTLPFVPLV